MSQLQLKPIVFKNMKLTHLGKDDKDIDFAYAELIFDDEETCLAHEYLPITAESGMKFLENKILDTNGYYACETLSEEKEYTGAFYNDNLIDVFPRMKSLNFMKHIKVKQEN